MNVLFMKVVMFHFPLKKKRIVSLILTIYVTHSVGPHSQNIWVILVPIDKKILVMLLQNYTYTSLFKDKLTILTSVKLDIGLATNAEIPNFSWEISEEEILRMGTTTFIPSTLKSKCYRSLKTNFNS